MHSRRCRPSIYTMHRKCAKNFLLTKIRATMRRLYLLLAIVATATVACVKNDVVLPHDEPVTSEEERYVVPVETALQALTNELHMIDGDGTRAGGPRTVKSVKSVKYRDMAVKTRSGETPEDIDDLIYIVEFEDGQGSAVLGADKRVDPVVAILDETVLTTEDFTNPSGDDDDIKNYVTSLISNSVTSGGDASTNGILPDVDLIATMTFIENDTLSVSKKGPLLRTKWHQRAPYNNDSPVIGNTVCPAGCGVIAVAQVLMYHKYPADSICINNEWFNWSLLSRYQYTSVLPKTPEATAEVAAFVRAIGISMNANYQSNVTTTDRYAARNILSNIFPSDAAVSLQSGLDENIVQGFIDTNNPILIRGENYDGGIGHMWVIDGHCTYVFDVWEVLKDTSFSPYLELGRTYKGRETVFKLHCNFGWGGVCDGYYTPRVFNTQWALNDADIEKYHGDYAGSSGNNYNSNFAIITYTMN